MLLKPNMIIAAKGCPKQASVEEVARASVACVSESRELCPASFSYPEAKNHLAATIHLNAISQRDGPKPWRLSFSFGRALQDEALRAWHGQPDNVEAGRRAFAHRAECARAATLGRYSRTMESELAA